MKRIYILFWLSLSALGLQAQSGMNRVLESIEANNKTLLAGKQMAEAQKLEANTGKYLANPTVELNQLWADRSVGGNSNELAVVQAFDFPTVYSNKNKLAKLKSATYDHQFAASRQQILLSAQQVCLEIVYLRKQKNILDSRLKNAERLTALYRQRLESGDANQMELNKIQLEKINAQNASRLNEAALRAQLEKLRNLNGGVAIDFTDDTYDIIPVLPEYSQLENEYLAADPSLKSLAGETEAANREVKLSRAQSLPKFDLGYRRNGGSEEKMNGFRIGMSIPLWENKNTVKTAKAQAEYAAANMDDNTQTLKSTLRELYTQVQALQNSSAEYAQALASQRNEELLNKALEAGQISMIDYFVEITLLYDSVQNYLDVEKEYHSLVAQLLQYTL
ncbi:MAG: TolC family protein [Odoribacter splanchnicus]|nr:TolC family protein [Odoribacter splanchnicus]